MSGFTIHIDCAERLKVEDIWPDGDAPARPTAQDVADLIQKTGSVASFINEWHMAPCIRVTVRGEGGPAVVW